MAQIATLENIGKRGNLNFARTHSTCNFDVVVTFGRHEFPVTLSPAELRCQSSKGLSTATMASTLLRSLRRTSRSTPASRLLSRQLSTSLAVRQDNLTTPDVKTGFDYHTVEDLHGMSAREILTGPTDDSKMRHFTGQ